MIISPHFDSKKTKHPTFKGPLDGAITQALIGIDTNPMLNAALVDTFAMVMPRTYIDTKKRNKYAGTETFLREAFGTIIVCLSAGVVAKGIASVHNKLVDKDVKISSGIWATNDSFDTLKEAWDGSKDTKTYVKKVLDGLSGLDGDKTSRWRNINWQNVQWMDKPSWKNISWHDSKWQGIEEKLKNEQGFVEALGDLIDGDVHKNDFKKVFSIIEHRMTNALSADNSVELNVKDKKVGTSLGYLIRDTYDLGKNLFTKNVDLQAAEQKLKSMNKVKSLGSIAVISSIALAVQYVNRQITKKRLGTDDFVGTLNFEGNSKVKKSQKKENKSGLMMLKLLASGGIFALSMAVMKIKSPAQFLKKLEFSSVVTSGNAIKTIYMASLIGRFMAARNKTELRESATRDYLGFLNWLVLGGFVSKGAAQLLFDRNQKELFNISKRGKGVSHWLNDVTLKSHAQIASKGVEFAKRNIVKINVAHVAGLAYSMLALGFAIPLLNIFMTGRKETKNIDKLSQFDPTLLNFTQNIKTPKSLSAVKSN